MTRGRYYFAPPNTPHYPGFHNLGSADWDYDAWLPYEPPELGEDRSLRLGYSKGSLGVAHPPPNMVGNGNCISEGEATYPAVSRPMTAGIDCRCWEQAGLVCPDQIPWLQLVGQSIPVLPHNANFERWKDTSEIDWLVQQPSPLQQPVAETDGSEAFPGGIFQGGRNLIIPQTLLGNRHSAYIVFQGYPVGIVQGTGPALAGTVNSRLLRQTRTQLSYITREGTGLVVNNAIVDNQISLVAIRRSPELVRAYVDGNLIGQGPIPTGHTLFLTSLLPGRDNATQNRRVLIFAVWVFLSDLTDAQDSSFQTLVKGIYGIP